MRGNWNLDRITVTKIAKCLRTNWCRKWRKTFKKEIFVVLEEYFEQQANCNRYRRKVNQSRAKEKSFVQESVVFTFPYETNGSHAREPSTVGYAILRTALERYFRFHWYCKQLQVEARNGMPNCEICFPIFSELIYANWKYFHSMVLGIVGRGYFKKNKMLEFLADIFV